MSVSFMPGPILGVPSAGSRSLVLRPSETAQQIVEIFPGDTGTAQTLAYMVRAIRGDDPFPPVSPCLRELAEDLLARHELLNRPSTETERALPLYGWVRSRMVIPQIKDRHGVEEIRAPDYLLRRIERLGRIPYDCDDSAILLSTLTGALGFPPRLVAISTWKSGEDEFSHVFTEVLLDGQWVPLDPILGREMGWRTLDQRRRLELPVWNS